MRGDDMDHVLDAFRMSELTGSHEGSVMKQRALFGLKHWTELPERDRDTVVRDLLVSTRDPNFATKDYRTMIATKTDVERDSIRAALMASGLANQDLLQALGI